MNPIIEKKKAELSMYIERHIVSEPAVKGIVAVGSIATGLARERSDIDAVVFLEPFDLYAVPAECKWHPDQDKFYGIMSAVENPIQLDFKRFDLTKWSQPAHIWPEPICAELNEGWVAFDRHNQIQPLIAKRIAYTDEIRQARLDEALPFLDGMLNVNDAEQNWETLGPNMAHDRLHAAYDFLVQALFAYNRRWRTWRSREMTYLLNLPWLPVNFEEQALLVSNALSSTLDGYKNRMTLLRHFLDELVSQCQRDKIYGKDAILEAFIRNHDEPGRDWNMDEWVETHQQRKQ
ncbi:MAG: nucleotidyltransferase domain-containing protein [Chloroflexota bacterium]